MRSAEEQEWAATELRNSLRSIEWDLEDLDDTVQIVEKNPAKFRIDTNDLAARKAFIKQTKDEVEQMKQKSSVPSKQNQRFSASEVLSSVLDLQMFISFFTTFVLLLRVLVKSPPYQVPLPKVSWCQA